MAKVWFIRHTESEANAGHPTWDSAKVELTERGRRQAEALAQSFSAKPSLIVTSSYIRTKQTASPTLQRFPDVPHQEWPVQEFTYLSFSHRFSTKQERRPLVEAFWERNDPEYRDGEGAESFYDFLTRVHTVFECLNRFDDEEFIAIFSHGQFIRAILWMLEYGSLPTDMKQFQHFLSAVPLGNGAVLEVTFWEQSMRYAIKQVICRPSLLESLCNLPDIIGNVVLV